jgi:hypothetical protein
MTKKYQITPLVWLVRDEASVKFHVASDDYFGTIATILSLIKQQIKRGGASDAATLNKIFKNLEKDLLYLQNNYQIKPKSRKKKITPKGKLISQ